jgi:hypothetical protein
MYSYSAYGLAVASTLPLPELIERNGGDHNGKGERRPDVSVRLDAVSAATFPLPENQIAGWVERDEACMFVPEVGRMLIRHGREIVFDPHNGLDESVMRLFILGPGLGVLLHQRGFLVLHASAVVADGQAVAFIGEKGQGKSTMAGAMARRGFSLLADDIVAIDVDATPQPLVYPGFPQIKLWPEAAAELGVNAAELPRIRPEIDKVGRRMEERFFSDAAPLGKIFVLADGDHDSIQSLPPQHVFMNLIHNCYTYSMLKQSGTQATHFRQTIRLAGKVPVMNLVRRRQLDRIDAVAKMVEAHLGRG